MRFVQHAWRSGMASGRFNSIWAVPAAGENFKIKLSAITFDHATVCGTHSWGQSDEAPPGESEMSANEKIVKEWLNQLPEFDSLDPKPGHYQLFVCPETRVVFKTRAETEVSETPQPQL